MEKTTDDDDFKTAMKSLENVIFNIKSYVSFFIKLFVFLPKIL